ncbi:hypothetical protein FACS1894200_13540 [Spirochaetia bacterium]|nr:hypothetical protein FACS1894200_13540 [Spirochaetia bacterium]
MSVPEFCQMPDTNDREIDGTGSSTVLGFPDDSIRDKVLQDSREIL